MGEQRRKYEEWLSKWKRARTAEEEAAILKVADIFDAFNETNRLSAEDLALIVEAASSPQLILSNAVDQLSSLALRNDDAARAVAEMFKSPKSNVRFAAICCLRRDTPASLADPLLTGGLRDKSAQVRRMAAQMICGFERKDLLPQLDAACASETNAKTRSSMEFELPLLRDGYILKPSNGGGYRDVTVRFRRGIVGVTISEKELQEKGIQMIASDLREFHDRRGF